MKNTLTCVYCGESYPEETPSHGTQILTDHIKICDKHPLRASEAKVVRLRTALAALVGGSTRTELEAMEMALRLLPAPENDKAVMINAIHVLIETE
jgi:hypothetical protein